MRIHGMRALAVINVMLCTAVSTSANPPLAIPFQAQLKTAGGALVNAPSQPITIGLYAAASGGAAVYTEAQTVPVANGLLNTTIGNGDAAAFAAIPFNVAYYVGVKVGTDPEMTPRLPLSAVPYANYATNVAPGALNGASWTLSGNSGIDPATQFIGTTDNQPVVVKAFGHQAVRYDYSENTAGQFRGINVLGGADLNAITAGAVGATIAGGGLDSFASYDHPNKVTGHFGTIGGGYANTSGFSATIAGGYGNQASGENSTVAGGNNNGTSGKYSAVGGGQSNETSKQYAAVGGGHSNRAQGDYAFIGGGDTNQATQPYAAVVGGNGNIAQGDYAFIGGGRDNLTGTYEAVVAGGRANQATGSNAAIAGGYSNVASGNGAAIPGGVLNAATGAYSFAAGAQAKSNHNGAFVWADDSQADFVSTGINQFLIRAGGGVGINTNTPLSTLDVYGNARISGPGNGLIFPDGTKLMTAGGGASGWGLMGNAGINPATNFLGTTDDQPFSIRVKNNRAQYMQYVEAPDGANVITSINIANGYGLNAITAGVACATIAGGGNRYGVPGSGSYADNINKVTDHYGTVGGGASNTAGNNNADLIDARGSTVAGGVGNQASKRYASVGGGNINWATGDYDTVAGGWNNQASGNMGFIGGGQNNRASGQWAVVGGGYTNNASGSGAAVPGGSSNAAAGLYSFAAGYRAKANHDGTFVWADGSALADFASTHANQFLIRASGGVGIGTYNPGYPLDVQGDINARGSVRANGVVLTSDARYKTGVRTLDGALDTISGLRGVAFDWDRNAWPDRGFPTGSQVGFIAQEVESVLPQLVSTDAQGYKAVAYANIVPIAVEAIKAMRKEIQSKDARIAALEAKAARVDALEARMKRLEQRLDAGRGR